ncbi:Peptide-N4-(N-acetyl-beta-glucosaminyl)asparagineamidase A [Linum grandiflorum]
MAPHLSCLVLIFLNSVVSTTANLGRFKSDPLIIPTATQSTNVKLQPKTVFFEVTKPISLPNTKPCVQHLLTSHDFADTLDKPPVVTNYTPPSHCPSSSFSKIVLEWNATCKGRQFDRIFGIWLGGVELLRSCTAEPIPSGIFWSVRKDITKYSSLLLRNETQDLAVFLGNIVDSTYTGIYNVNVSIYFYPGEQKFQKTTNNNNVPADLILPISRNIQSLKDGLWFQIQNSTQMVSKQVVIPCNVYRAVLEVYISPHGDDEFWYTNYPNDYIISNNISSTTSPGNGPFREVVVSLDEGDTVIGAIWPFTVVYTGGIINLFWRPISGIGSFDLPSYDIEVTPFLGTLLDNSKAHSFGFRVTNALDVWFVDANLHLWLDTKREKTEAMVVKHDSNLDLDVHSKFKGLDGKFTTDASRSVYSHGWVKSSHGNITTRFQQRLKYSNWMELRKDGHVQILNQTISTYDTASFKPTSKKEFSINLYTDTEEKDNNTVSYATDLTLGYSFKGTGSAVKNVQKAKGDLLVKGNLVTSGIGSTRQKYRSRGGDGSCYFRDIKSSNYTILADKEGTNCN